MEGPNIPEGKVRDAIITLAAVILIEALIAGAFFSLLLNSIRQ